MCNVSEMHIKLRHLEVFNALFEAGSVSRAAVRLNLTQPAVSVALSNLEAELGFRLFHRSKGFFEPTGKAMLLQDEFEQGLLAISRIEQRAAAIKSGATGGVSIATNGTLAVNFLPRTIASFQKKNPGINVELRVGSSRRIASWVSERQIDIGFIDTPVPVAGLNAELYAMECVCIMRKDDPLCVHKVIHPKTLSGRSVIAIMGDHYVDRQLNQLLSKSNTSVTRNLSSYYFAIARNMVSESGNLAIIDPINGKIDLSDGVTWRPFHPRVDHELAMLTSSDQPLGQAARDIHEEIQAQLNSITQLTKN